MPSNPPPPISARKRLLSRLVSLQVERPVIPLVLAATLTLVSVLLALRLRVHTGFEHLLPQNRPSVVELNRVAAHTSGVSTLFIVLEATDQRRPPPVEALRKAGDALVAELLTVGPPWVGSAEDGVHDAIEFFARRAALFGELEKLHKVRREIDERFEYELAKQTDSALDDEPPPEIKAARLKEVFGWKEEDAERYPGGYYQSKDGRVLVVAVRSKVHGSDFEKGAEALRRVHEAVRRVNPGSYDPSLRYGLTGDLQTGIAEYTAIHEDLTKVGYTGAVLIIAVVFLYYLRLRTLLTMVLTIGIGVAWTFGTTQLVLGHLNVATGFLFTIIAGNGINFGIIYMARYLEVRRKGAALREAIETAHRETWLPTLTACCAAGVSYGSLMVTEFRGFRDFGLIGGAGMILCWLATYWTLPAILAVTEKVVPLERRGLLGWLRDFTQGGVAYGTPFASLVSRAPRLIVALGLLLSASGVLGMVFYILGDPMEYNMMHLRNVGAWQTETARLTRLAESTTGFVGSDGMALLVERPDDVAPLREALLRRRDAAPAHAKPFESVHALQDFVPADQQAKIPVVLAIRDKLLRAHKQGAIPEEDWGKVDRYLPPPDLSPFGLQDLPVGVARPFQESDGTRGRIVYISPTKTESTDDARYIFRWADSFRSTPLPDGRTVLGSGRAVIYADLWAAILSDVPSAVLFSLLATVLVVVLAFRAGRPALVVIAGLLVGTAWMAGVLVLLKVKLNFLNFIALPITFGIGVDYAVNIVQRYVREGVGGVLTSVRETGGAVTLCSLTTILGYLALAGSMNYSVRSLGIAAVIGELCCLLAAVLVLPAALLWLDRGRAAGTRSRISLHD